LRYWRSLFHRAYLRPVGDTKVFVEPQTCVSDELTFEKIAIDQVEQDLVDWLDVRRGMNTRQFCNLLRPERKGIVVSGTRGAFHLMVNVAQLAADLFELDKAKFGGKLGPA